MKKSCVIYDSWSELIINLPDEMAGQLIKMVLGYAFGEGCNNNENPAINAIFEMMKSKIDEDCSKYYAQVERARNNSKRSHTEVIPKSNEVGTKSDRSHTKVKGVSVSDSVYVSVSESDSESVKDKKHIYGEYRHVRLTDAERDRLFNDYGEAETLAAIKFLDEYIQEKPGYKSKDHNLAMRRWVFDAVKEQKAKHRSIQPQEKSLAEKWGLTNDT